ncbi:MAG: putative Ribokinase [Candidatus Saccharibacteria bacterium]|nr:putative Ribokinase [Candidatus Saccharibacteria bacterium]
MKTLDVLSVGDIVTDAFIKLLDNEGQVIQTEKGLRLSLPFATKVPFDHAEVIEAVGNSANAAVCFARLGFGSGLVANVGSDKYGRDMIDALHDNEVDSRFVRINPHKISNYHYVLWYKDERTILIKHEEYEYYWPHLRPNEIPQWLYFSSISKNAIDFHDDVADWLEKHPEVKLAFQPGTFQMQAGAKRLERIYKQTEVLLLNREEAVVVGGGKHEDVNNLFDHLHALGPKIVVITDGPRGAYASGPEGRYQMPNYPDPKPPFERTGAGDAFSATFVGALMKGSNIEGALQWAPINAMSVVQQVGAQRGLLTEHQLAHLLKEAPQWYHPKRL